MTVDAPTESPALSKPKPDDPRLVHLVLKDSWPIALCGAVVTDRLGARAPAMDRCLECNRLARKNRLGNPGWAT